MLLLLPLTHHQLTSSYEGKWIYNGQEKNGHKVISAKGGTILGNTNWIFSVTIHEIGHALGWCGHSSNSDDKMYAADNADKQTVTTRDLEHLAQVND